MTLYRKIKKRISKISKKAENLTPSDRIELAYYKHSAKQKVSYDEYVLMLSTGDELSFEYKDAIYENVLGEDPGSVYFCKITYKGDIVVKQECEMYENINEMLNKVRICGKTIKDIWNDVIF